MKKLLLVTTTALAFFAATASALAVGKYEELANWHRDYMEIENHKYHSNNSVRLCFKRFQDRMMTLRQTVDNNHRNPQEITNGDNYRRDHVMPQWRSCVERALNR